MLPFILKVATVVWIDSLGSASIGLFVTRNFVTRDWLNGTSSETFSLRESHGALNKIVTSELSFGNPETLE